MNAQLIGAALHPERRPRTITLGKYSLEPVKVPTERWQSFGWNVSRIELRLIEERELVTG